jgi:hypothetical protein
VGREQILNTVFYLAVLAIMAAGLRRHDKIMKTTIAIIAVAVVALASIVILESLGFIALGDSAPFRF